VIEPVGLGQQNASPIRPANAPDAHDSIQGGALEVLTKADDYRLGRSDGERIGTPAARSAPHTVVESTQYLAPNCANEQPFSYS
jgi:hypothetical protein